MSGLTFVDWYPERCRAVVYKRDCYRVARGSPSGFRMHYTKCQCTRRPVVGLLVCAQHAATHARSFGVPEEIQRKP